MGKRRRKLIRFHYRSQWQSGSRRAGRGHGNSHSGAANRYYRFARLYSFQSLPVGHYDIQIEAPGFRPMRRTGLMIDVSGKVVVDVSLEIGGRTDEITVSAATTQVDTSIPRWARSSPPGR